MAGVSGGIRSKAEETSTRRYGVLTGADKHNASIYFQHDLNQSRLDLFGFDEGFAIHHHHHIRGGSNREVDIESSKSKQHHRLLRLNEALEEGQDEDRTTLTE